MKHDSELFAEPPHPEVVADEFELASDETKGKLFELVEKKAKTGGTEDIGLGDPMHVLQLDLSDGQGNLELVWTPGLPEEDGIPADPDSGHVVKTLWIKDGAGKVTSAIETRYSLNFHGDEMSVTKEQFDGFTPADNKAIDALTVDAQSRRVPTQAEAENFARAVMKHMEEDGESMDEYASRRQMEMEIGLADVSESEANELIHLINHSTPVGQ